MDYFERRIRQYVADHRELVDQLLEDVGDQDNEQADAIEADFNRPDSEAGGTGGPLPQKAQAPVEKIQIPPSLVVQDETKKAKR